MRLDYVTSCYFCYSQWWIQGRTTLGQVDLHLNVAMGAFNALQELLSDEEERETKSIPLHALPLDKLFHVPSQTTLWVRHWLYVLLVVRLLDFLKTRLDRLIFTARRRYSF